LYTQCPECSTVFRITAEALRVAQGYVRCGICSTRFNALHSLSDSPAAVSEQQPPENTITVEELPGNELIDLSSADEPETDSVDLSPQLETGDEAEAATEAPTDESLEFHGTPEEVERLFIMAATAESADAAAGGQSESSGESDVARNDEFLRAIDEIARADFSGIEVEEGSLFDMDDPASIAAALASPVRDNESENEGENEVEVEGAARRDFDLDAGIDEIGALDRTDEFPILALDAAETTPEDILHEEPPRILIPAALRRDLAESSSSAADDIEGKDDSGQEPRRGGALRLAIGVLLVLALALQGVHFWRDDLARNTVAGPWILQAYAALGLSIDPPTDLAGFELRQWGATSDANQPGQLRLRASIVNRAAFAQPLPLLRLSLQDRFGNTIGVRDVAADDYLPGGSGSAPRLLAPQQRADAEIVFVDPGREAVGFELDVCLDGPSGVRCASALPSSRP